MALSGSYSGSIANGGYTLRVDWTASQSVQNNTSTITSTAYLVFKKGYDLYIGGRKATQNWVRINGNSIGFSTSAISMGTGGGTIELGTTTHVVEHDAGGKATFIAKANFAIQASIGNPAVTYNNITTDEVTFTLNDIPRASTPIITNASFGSPINISWTPAVSSYKYVVSIESVVSSESLPSSGTITPGSTSTYTYSGFTVPYSMITTTTSFELWKCILSTYDSNLNLIGSVNQYFYLQVPTNEYTIPGLIIVSEPIDGFRNYYLVGRSSAKLNLTITPKYGATLYSTTVKINGRTVQTSYDPDIDEIILPVITSSSTIYTVEVTDSRYKTTTQNVEITAYAYSDPEMTLVTSRRWNVSTSSYDDNSWRIKCEFNALCSDINSENSCSVNLQYRVKGAEEYQNAGTITSGYISPDPSSLDPRAFSPDNTYELMYTVTDSVGNYSIYYDIISTSFTLMNFSPKGIAFGKASEGDKFECDLDVEFKRSVKVEYVTDRFIDAIGEYTGGAKIPANSDVNNYIYLGTWYVETDADTNYISNLPAPYAGKLMITTPINKSNEETVGSFIVQEYMTCIGNKYLRYASVSDSEIGFVFGSWINETGGEGGIPDIDAIRAGAALGATAVQPEDLADVATSGNYSDLVNKPSIEGVTLSGNKTLSDLGISQIYTVIGTQSASTNAWTGNLSAVSELFDGLTILYFLPYAGTSTAATLKLTLSGGTQTAAVPVYYTGTSGVTTHYAAGSTILLTYWSAPRVAGTVGSPRWSRADYSVTNSNTVAQVSCATAAATAAKTATSTYFYLVSGVKTWFTVQFRYANTYKGKVTLNINSIGAHDVYLNGSITSSTNYDIKRMTYIAYFDGSNYYLRTDGKVDGIQAVAFSGEYDDLSHRMNASVANETLNLYFESE
jgi:hypothetical protein